MVTKKEAKEKAIEYWNKREHMPVVEGVEERVNEAIKIAQDYI